MAKTVGQRFSAAITRTIRSSRILALGDSFIEGYTVPLPQTVTQVLESSLGAAGCAAQAINGGAAGYSSDQELLFYETEGQRYAPRVVVLFFYYNDVVYNDRQEFFGAPKPVFEMGEGRLCVHRLPVKQPSLPRAAEPAPEEGEHSRSALVDWVRERLWYGAPEAHDLLARLGLWRPMPRMDTRLELRVYERRRVEPVEDAWAKTAAILAELDAQARSRSARLLLAYVPSRLEIDERTWRLTRRLYGGDEAGGDRGRVAQRLKEAAAPAGIPVLDLTEALRRADEAGGPPRAAARRRPGDEAEARARTVLLDRIQRDGLSPARPLAIIRDRPFVRERIAPEPKPYDDRGRAVLLGLAFRLRGGIAPFLILWLGWMLAPPVLAGTAVELCAAGCARSVAVFALLVGLSPFVAETLALPRNTVGFYLAGLFLVIPIAVYARLRPAPTLRGLAIRVSAAALVFALCIFCRSSVALLVPGMLLAVWAGTRGLRSPWPRCAVTVAAAALFSLPTLLVGQTGHHDVWQSVWEGVGDFDREKGHAWSDPVAESAARRAGAAGMSTPERQAFFRAQVIADVAGDPAWFAGILVRRLAATVTLWKLWPWSPWDGTFLRPSTSMNGGLMDKYWAALAVPVLISTAAGQETQAFGVTFLLAAAFATELVGRRGAERDAGR